MSAYRYDRLKVLVIDDNAHMRALLAAILRAFGITAIAEAGTADEGWEHLHAGSFDLAFCGWVMEGQSGIGFTQRLRNAPDSPNPYLPVLILSGDAGADRMQAARNAGVNEFLAKPISAKTVLGALSAAIDNPRPFVRTTEYFGPCRRRYDEAYHGPERRIEPSKTIPSRSASAA